MVGGEEGKDAGMGQRKPAPSIKIHNPTFLLSQVIFGDRAGPSPMFRSYHLPLVTTRPAGAPQPPQSYHPRPQGLTSGHRANWSCCIRGVKLRGPSIIAVLLDLSDRSAFHYHPYLEGSQTDDSPLLACGVPLVSNLAQRRTSGVSQPAPPASLGGTSCQIHSSTPPSGGVPTASRARRTTSGSDVLLCRTGSVG